MTPAEALLHIRYSIWASNRLWNAVSDLPIEHLEQERGVSHGSLLGTLAHILLADWIWYTRVVEPMERPGKTRDALEKVWPEVHARWEMWAKDLTDAGLQRVVSYKTSDGTAYETPVWQIVLHLVNHATLHRGQAMAILRQMGVPPPPTDLIFYYRELAEKHA